MPENPVSLVDDGAGPLWTIALITLEDSELADDGEREHSGNGPVRHPPVLDDADDRRDDEDADRAAEVADT